MYRSNYVFAILFGALLMMSMMSASAEVALFNSSPDQDPVLRANSSIFSSVELNGSTSINNESISLEMLNLPLSFIENQGQFSEDVRFMVQTGGQTVLFAPSKVVFRPSKLPSFPIAISSTMPM